MRVDYHPAIAAELEEIRDFRLVDQDTIRVTIVKHEKRHPAFGIFRR
jgi:hypothetical protein